MKSKDMIPAILVIAGSDPCGGAGLQADLKTLTVLGVYGAAVVTCITVQNSRGVQRIEPLPPDLVREQVKAVLEDHHVTHIKLGMVGSADIAGMLGPLLADFKGEVICDPVMAAGTGHDLLGQGAFQTLQKAVLPSCTVLTPNLPELTALTGVDDTDQGVEQLFARFTRLNCIVVKGGHGRVRGGKLTDTCFLREERREINHPQQATHNLHGTGCTMASAMAAYLLMTGSYTISFRKSVNFMERLITGSAAYEIVRSRGQGPLLHHLGSRENIYMKNQYRTS